MKRAAGALALLMLYACNKSQVSGDGYEFRRKEFTHLAPDIRFVEHPSLADLRASAPAEARHTGLPLGAWSTLSGADHQTCTVHIVDPSAAYMPEMIGHEIVHCIHGRWHD